MTKNIRKEAAGEKNMVYVCWEGKYGKERKFREYWELVLETEADEFIKELEEDA